MSRICYNCKHVYFDAGDEAWSEVTPGASAFLECLKDHWDLMETRYHWRDFKPGRPQDLKTALEMARTCPDYEHSRKAKELGIADDGGSNG